MPAPVSAPSRKKPTNLTLDPARLEFATDFAARRSLSLSGLVDDLLAALEATAKPSAGPKCKDPLDGILAGMASGLADKRAIQRSRARKLLSR